MVIKLVGVNYLMVLRDHEINKKNYISTSTTPVANKLGRVVTYHKGISFLQSHDPLVIESCKIT